MNEPIINTGLETSKQPAKVTYAIGISPLTLTIVFDPISSSLNHTVHFIQPVKGRFNENKNDVSVILGVTIIHIS